MTGPLPIRRLTVAQYDAMAAAGILTADDRVELLDGLLVEKRPRKPPRRIAAHRALDALRAIAPSGWYVDSQEPIVTADSEPEPDAAVIRGDTGDYRGTGVRGRARRGGRGRLARTGSEDQGVDLRACPYPSVLDRERRRPLRRGVRQPRGDGAEAAYATRTDHRTGTIAFSLDGAAREVRVEDLFR